MKDPTELMNRLTDTGETDAMRESLSAWENLTPEIIEDTVAWIDGKRQHLLSLINDVEDPEMLEESFAVQYIEFKSTWMSLNTRLNFQMVKQGAPSNELVARATTLSMLIDIVDDYLKDEDITVINDFLAEQPTSRAA